MDAANSAPKTSATVDRHGGSPSARRSSRQSPTMNNVSVTSPRSNTASAASAQDDSALLRKKAATSSRVASNAGSPKDASAMIGTKTRTMPASPAQPVTRANVAQGSGCDMGFSMARLRTRVSEWLVCPRPRSRNRSPPTRHRVDAHAATGRRLACDGSRLLGSSPAAQAPRPAPQVRAARVQSGLRCDATGRPAHRAAFAGASR